ncbi:phage tail family protein [Bacillus paralicheniformis]|uniref:phage tail family protein n=2 Tax=Bacillus paralicheniformis TaxID=1648923 RepID=UPI002244E858|nr:phage tail family protein [Bacillus paralicheniformis]MEC1023579.1 phage tail family protein [Bacillus paralicheniformis]MEC1027447.1 phage tail family protein [Bacillus paralicheniformis]MEC1034411.1 phage tail family protein [Bacillus paralicheniformis]MEC1050206.1 phage tail family protein [Bacillus paralicheniformis]MEC1059856.1 phage tail family protein [Bacillus paralicheniformis]
MKVLHNFKIVYKDGTVYDMASDFNVLVRSFTVSSPSPNIESETIDNGDGYIRMGKTWGPRKISALCMFFGNDDYDYYLLRNKLYQVLMERDEYYLISDAEPWKRWLVEVSNEWSPSQMGVMGEFEISFVSASAYAESIGTTLDQFTADSGLWYIGSNIPSGDIYPLKYEFSNPAAQCWVYNASDVAIDPRKFPLEITFTGAADAGMYIQNYTNNTRVGFKKALVDTDVLVFSGTRVLLNGVPSFSDSKRSLLTLEKGWNRLGVRFNHENTSLKLNFRFYYI